MSERPGRGSPQFPLRFPQGMRDVIKGLAADNGRTMNTEIIALISLGLLLSKRVHQKREEILLASIEELATKVTLDDLPPPDGAVN